MSDPSYPLFSVLAFLGFAFVLIPLPWHLEAWNSGTCYYMVWTALACINQFVNSIIWAGNARNSAPIWCEISIRIVFGSSVGIPAASLCIMRRLYSIANVQAVMLTPATKRRAIIIDTLICVLFPLVFIGLQYISQGHRFDIFEDIGCTPYVYNSAVAYMTTAVWPIVLGLVSAIYSVLSIRAFIQRRAQLAEFLSSSKLLTMGRYLRLMALASTEIICTTPLAIFVTYLNTLQGVVPYTSWADVHYNYSRVGQYLAVDWQSDRKTAIALELGRWLPTVCAFVFFIFFGFAEEARKNYRAAYRALGRLLGETVNVPAPKQRSARSARHPGISHIVLDTVSSSSEFVRQSSVRTSSSTDTDDHLVLSKPPSLTSPYVADMESFPVPDNPSHLREPRIPNFRDDVRRFTV